MSEQTPIEKLEAALAENVSLSAQVETLKADIGAAQQLAEEAGTQVTQMSAEIEQLKASLTEAEANLSATATERDEINAKLTQAKQKLENPAFADLSQGREAVAEPTDDSQKQMTRAEFENLPADKRMAFVKAGGKLI